jgi:ribosomal protein L31E
MIMADEKVYVIPLKAEVLKSARDKRTKRAVNTIRRFLVKHTKAKKVSISQKINEAIWKHSRQKPPNVIKLRVKIQDGVAVTRAMDEMFIEKAKEEPKSIKELVDKVQSEPKVPDEAPAKGEPKDLKDLVKEADSKPAKKKAKAGSKHETPKKASK